MLRWPRALEVCRFGIALTLRETHGDVLNDAGPLLPGEETVP